jgi:hypothetical protein
VSNSKDQCRGDERKLQQRAAGQSHGEECVTHDLVSCSVSVRSVARLDASSRSGFKARGMPATLDAVRLVAVLTCNSLRAGVIFRAMKRDARARETVRARVRTPCRPVRGTSAGRPLSARGTRADAERALVSEHLFELQPRGFETLARAA